MARRADTGREMRERLGYYQRLGCCGKYFACRQSSGSMRETKRLFFLELLERSRSKGNEIKSAEED